MRVILAAPRGFCAGVNMAIEALNWQSRRTARRCTPTTKSFTTPGSSSNSGGRGWSSSTIWRKFPKAAPLLYSAHGVPPEVRRQAAERHLLTIDATCPLVTKVHREAIRLCRSRATRSC